MIFVSSKTLSQDKIIFLSTLDLSKMTQGSGNPKIDKNSDTKPLSIAGQIIRNGVGTQVKSCLWINLAGGSKKFSANVGIDDDTTKRFYSAAHNFQIVGDGKKLWESGPMHSGEPAKKVELNTKGIKTLILLVINTGMSTGNKQADWGDAFFAVTGQSPQTIDPPREPAIILTPKPGPGPQINGPTVYACRPGNPFLYRIPATGNRPMMFSAVNLPAGLKLDASTGIITGSVESGGEFAVTLSVKNNAGNASRVFKIKCGDKLALTPTMGWNDWYAFYGNITDKLMRAAADSLISNGMADVGYQYVDVDDCWSNAAKSTATDRAGPPRDKNGNILSNSDFPDMGAMANYIHSKGLKAGIYSSPGPTTCAGYTASYGHEAQDAQQFANWGFDLLKYDWCSYGRIESKTTDSARQKPYRLMSSQLQQQKRDIVFNLCQYGMNSVWKWGADVGGNSWRTGGDLGYHLNQLFEIALRNAGYGDYNKPGTWNDPDYIQIGYMGNTPTKLYPNEQYAFMSLWCLLAAPLVYSGNLNKMDNFTLNILCNPEVIAIDQDPLGKCAKVVQRNDDSFIMVKELEDGSKAVGLCNESELPLKITLKLADAGLSGKQLIRDLWRQKNLGLYRDKFSIIVPRHGVELIRISNK